jgi:hypothetical protein
LKADSIVTLSDRPPIREHHNLEPEWVQEIGTIASFAARVEDDLHRLYWYYAHLQNDIGAIITGDLSPNRLTEDIIKLTSLNKKQERRLDDLRLLFSEYRSLATQRNQVVHWTWANVINNQSTLIRPEYKRPGGKVKYTFDDLRNLSMDLSWLHVRLSAHINSDHSIRQKRAHYAAMCKEFPNYNLTVDMFLPSPWLYKRAQPNPRRAKHRATQKSQKRPPRSSPA